MEDSGDFILGNIIKLTRSSEKKFKLGNFKGALEDKMKANAILKSKSCDEKIMEKYKAVSYTHLTLPTKRIV